MAVTINSTDTLDYTWANAPGTWALTDADAVKPWSAYYQQTVTVTADESLTTAELMANNAAQAPSEAFATAEALTALIAPAAQEGWSTSDTLLDLMNWVQNATEGFTTGDGTANVIAPLLFEVFSTLDANTNAYSGQQNEGFTTADAMAPTTTWLRTIAEGWVSAEVLANGYSDQQSEAFSTADSRTTSYSDQQNEEFYTAEVGASVTQWVRQLAEAWQTTDAGVVSYAQAIADAWNTRDMYLRNAGGVIGDIDLSQSAMSLNDFTNLMNSHSPVGFSPFKELVAGDYLYQDAIVWMRMQSQRTSTDTVSITQATLEVDVPDQFDSGSIDIPAGGKRVLFSRTFNVVPYVVAQVVGGTQLAYADITEIDETGFFVSCLNMSNTAQSIEGVVSWKASGY